MIFISGEHQRSDMLPLKYKDSPALRLAKQKIMAVLTVLLAKI